MFATFNLQLLAMKFINIIPYTIAIYSSQLLYIVVNYCYYSIVVNYKLQYHVAVLVWSL